MKRIESVQTDGKGRWIGVGFDPVSPFFTRAYYNDNIIGTPGTWTPYLLSETFIECPALATDGQGNWVTCGTQSSDPSFYSSDNGLTWSTSTSPAELEAFFDRCLASSVLLPH